jgi:hypothetical protein
MSEKMKKFVIDRKTAEEEFERFCDSWEIDNDTSGMSEEDTTAFDGNRAKFINAVMRGRLKMDDSKDCLVYTFSDKSPDRAGQSIEVHRPKGASYLETDNYKSDKGMHKTFAILASMSGQDPKYFSRIDGVDMKPLQAVMTLFLAS